MTVAEELKSELEKSEVESKGPLRVCSEDGTFHFSEVKKLALSGRQYLYAVNNEFSPTPAMLLGTAVHLLVLGPRQGAKPVVRYPGLRRSGKEWDKFDAENKGAEILTAPEWERAAAIAAAVLADPLAQKRFDGARFEVPLTWMEGEMKCSTSGIDVVNNGAICDLKTTYTTEPRAWKNHAFKMSYHCQMAWYRRAAIANGIDVSKGTFLLGVETKPPYEIVELDLQGDLLDLADRTVCLWLEELRRNILSIPEPRIVADWPGYAAAPVEWSVPAWMAEDEDDADEEEAA